MVNDQNSETKNSDNRPTWSGKAGTVEVSVWDNENADGNVFRSTQITKNYYDKKTDTWKKGTSLAKHDLPMLILLLQDAYRDIVVRENSN